MVSRTCLHLYLVAALLGLAAAADPFAAQFNSQWNGGSQFQSGNNIAWGNKGPVNQQSSNQAISQKGNNNVASTYNDQQIVGCDTSGVNQQASNQGIQQAGNGNGAGTGNNQGISGRRLADVSAQSSSNVVAGANGVNQQSSNQAIKQTGNNNYASTSATGLIKCSGRRLLSA